MDGHARIDHDILARNLNAVCRELGRVSNRSGTGFFAYPPALNYGDIENSIPLALHNVAVSAGWIDPPLELEESDLDSGKADLLGGSLIVERAYKEWFLGLVADALIDLEAIADKNFNAQSEYDQIMLDFGPKMLSAQVDGLSETSGVNSLPQRNGDDNPAGRLIKRFFEKSETIHDLQDLIDAATRKKPDGEKYPVSRSSVSRIYNGYGAGAATRQVVASVISEVIPCHKDDLRGTKKKLKAKN